MHPQRAPWGLAAWLSMVISSVAWSPLSGSEAAAEQKPALPARNQTPYVLVMLARAPEIHAELGLDRRQAEALVEAVDEVDVPLWRLRDLPEAQSGERVRQLTDGFRARLRAVLRPIQRQRLDQLVLRIEGWQALGRPEIAEKLKLSPGQLGRIEGLLAAASKPGARPAKPEGVDRQREIMAVLSKEQQKQLAALAGKPFDFSRVRRRAVRAPELRGIDAWVNSPPLTLAGLRGKVVVLHFWTFGCVNCTRNYPHYKAWHTDFPGDRLVVLGIHTPEGDDEHDLARLRRAAKDAGLAFPIAADNRRENWSAWGNHVWPSVYLIDKQGYVRTWWYGELNWEGAEGDKLLRETIGALLAEDP